MTIEEIENYTKKVYILIEQTEQVSRAEQSERCKKKPKKNIEYNSKPAFFSSVDSLDFANRIFFFSLSLFCVNASIALSILGRLK